RAEPRKKAKQGDVGARLDGIAKQVRLAAKGLAEDSKMARQGSGRVDVGGRAHRAGDAGERHALGAKDAAAIVEMIHGGRGAQHPASGAAETGAASGGRGGLGGALMPQAAQSTTASAPAMAVCCNRMGLLALETDAEHPAQRLGGVQVRA